MTDKKSNESRRKLLKSIAAGSGAIVAGKSLPESWSRPVVDSVMLPAHAQTSISVCSCLLSNLAVNAGANTFSATYTWSTCSNIFLSRMIITGPGVIDLLGYVQPTSNASGSRDFVALGPYNATVFQLGQTYTFTVIVEDAGSNVLQTCIDTVIAT